MIMEYSITIDDLIKREEIRDDFSGNQKWNNKLTDEEINTFHEECRQMCIEEGVPEKFPDMNSACLAKDIDRGILYFLFILSSNFIIHY